MDVRCAGDRIRVRDSAARGGFHPLRARTVLVLLMTTALVVLAGAVEPARATDSQAPPGSGNRWLPTEDWVMRHWLPYDEAALYRELRTDRAGVRRWLRDDHRTLEQLARRRGVETAGLAQHVLFHVMHQPAIGVEAPRLFGVAPSRYMLRRLNGHSPVRIARVESRGQRRRLASRVVRVVRRSGDEGVRVGATSSRTGSTRGSAVPAASGC